ncbi:MAG TPA: hypothetical protein VFE58_07490 [Tepidisphaeraceae bacterium]|jgi:hypothetical protein|nr:hypothetical protein [Tepidisphaeraceae bacterium]
MIIINQIVGSSVCIALGLLAGCASSNDHQTVIHHDGVKDVSAHDPGLAQDRETRHGMVFEDRVPSTAAEITQHTTLTDSGHRVDAVLLGRATLNGDACVVDVATGRIVYGGHLLKGQTLLVNLDHNELALDGRPITAIKIDGSREYKIYFLAG